MIESKVICPSCKKNSINKRYQTFWQCSECGEKYSCVNGMPKLYLEDTLGKSDKGLRDNVYQYMAWFYNFWNPFFMLPVRPIKVSIKLWIAYFLLVFSGIFLVYNAINLIAFRGVENTTALDVLFLVILVIYVYAFAKQPRYAHLLWLAIPIKIILASRKFKPKRTHASIHAEFQKEFLQSDEKIRMLDIASGSGNSLFRHGWMKLNAEYTAVDLSAGMIVQGRRLMSKNKVPADFILTDATKLPFEDETFDICTNYGAFNGFSDTKSALKEMVRVTKRGGKILILDEREYEDSSWLEHLYFRKVFAPYNTLVGTPADLDPDELEDIQVHQPYEFVYIVTARKKMQSDQVHSNHEREFEDRSVEV